MYYELYIDQFFVEQFLIGAMLLSAAGALMGAPSPRRRLLLGALLGAGCMTAFVCLRMPYFYPVSLPAAAAAAFWRRPWKMQWRHNRNGTLCLLVVTVCFGGAAEALCSLFPLPVTAVFFLAAATAYEVVRCLGRWNRRGENAAEIRIRKNGREILLHGLFDTGNQLTEPVTGRPVSIAETAVLTEILGEGWEEQQGFCLIPYHSLGEEKGWLRAVVVDEMEVTMQRGRRVVRRPLIALYEGKVSGEGNCRMILHPEHAP